MRICTISHSHVALRQQLFFQGVAKWGHEVLMISPGEWGNLRTSPRYAEVLYAPDEDMGPRVFGRFELKTCRHMMGENIYQYHLLGARGLAEEFKPDVLYIQAEPGSSLAQEAIMWDVPKRALFTWENIKFEESARSTLEKYDVVICGNPEAEALAKPWNPHTVLMLQVGVDTDHFQARPDVERNIDVAYAGRIASEKGLPYLQRAWPTVKILDWKDFKELPWWYSQVKVIVAYSQDVPWWKEQAPNYVVLEALLCGCRAITSDTNAMEYWLNNCPGVVMVSGHDQSDDTLRMDRVDRLREGIQRALEVEIENEGRQWVIDKFSNQVVAKKLLEVLYEMP